MNTDKTDTKYIVGHYVQYYVSKDFHVDFTHNDLKSAMESWQHLCEEFPNETDVEIRKQTTETVVSRKLIDEDDGSNRYSSFNYRRE
jgi:hypothetical protein